MSIKNKNKTKDASDLSGFLCLAVWQAGQSQSQSISVFTKVDVARRPALETTHGSTSSPARCILKSVLPKIFCRLPNPTFS